MVLIFFKKKKRVLYKIVEKILNLKGKVYIFFLYYIIVCSLIIYILKIQEDLMLNLNC